MNSSNPMEHRLVTAEQVRALCGGISDMSLWRWIHNPGLGFPRAVYIQRRRFWREAEVIAWLQQLQPSGHMAKA